MVGPGGALRRVKFKLMARSARGCERPEENGGGGGSGGRLPFHLR